MWNFGAWELVIILLIVLVLFGASRLEGVGRALGGGIRDFRRSFQDDKDVDDKAEQAKR